MSLPSWKAPTLIHYNDAIMSLMASQITSFTIVCSAGYSGADKKKHKSSAPLGFVLGIHRWPVNAPHKGPVRRKLFPFDDVIMRWYCAYPIQSENNSGLVWVIALTMFYSNDLPERGCFLCDAMWWYINRFLWYKMVNLISRKNNLPIWDNDLFRKKATPTEYETANYLLPLNI